MTPRGFIFRLLGVGWFVAICIVGGAAFGLYVVDNAFDTKPIFALIFLTLGAIFAMYMVWRWLSPGVKKPTKRNGGKEQN